MPYRGSGGKGGGCGIHSLSFPGAWKNTDRAFTVISEPRAVTATPIRRRIGVAGKRSKALVSRSQCEAAPARHRLLIAQKNDARAVNSLVSIDE
jgi:hypothetical protein